MKQLSEKRMARRAHLRQVMRCLLLDLPHERVRMEEVARAAEVSVGAIYMYFLSKDDLIVSMLEDSEELGPAEWAALHRLASPGLDRISSLTLRAASNYLDASRLRAIGDAFSAQLVRQLATVQAADVDAAA